MVFLSSLRLKDFMSFGVDIGTIPLLPLNVIVGPNGSGKTNFVKSLQALRAASLGENIDLGYPACYRGRAPYATVRADLDSPDGAMIFLAKIDNYGRTEGTWLPRSPACDSPFARFMHNIRVYGPHIDDFFLSRLKRVIEDAATRQRLFTLLKKTNTGTTGVEVDKEGNFYVLEGSREVSLRCIGAGILQLLFLLSILLDPLPSSLIVIEHPEYHLHKPTMGVLAEALLECSKNRQVVVTTHSADLLSCMSHCPEVIVRCNSDFGVSILKRVPANLSSVFMEDIIYSDLVF